MLLIRFRCLLISALHILAEDLLVVDLFWWWFLNYGLGSSFHLYFLAVE
jgi:hypothetical protein